MAIAKRSVMSLLPDTYLNDSQKAPGICTLFEVNVGQMHFGRAQCCPLQTVPVASGQCRMPSTPIGSGCVVLLTDPTSVGFPVCH